jgi:lysophospholipase L1-like esterase
MNPLTAQDVAAVDLATRTKPQGFSRNRLRRGRAELRPAGARRRLGAGLVMLGLSLFVVGCSSGSPTGVVPSATESTPLSLVAIGDSIPFNDPNDCPGCVGFVDQYAEALSKKTGRPVNVSNLSQHNGLTLSMLAAELPKLQEELSAADAIIVGIAHNSFPLAQASPCGMTSIFGDWSKVDAECAEDATRTYQPKYDALYSTVAGYRTGKPTILLTINRYNDWLGSPDGNLTPDQDMRTVLLHDAWNDMLCDAAEDNGFACVDIYHQFNGPDGTTPSGDHLGADYTHPSQKGNDVIKEALIAQGFNPLA